MLFRVGGTENMGTGRERTDRQAGRQDKTAVHCTLNHPHIPSYMNTYLPTYLDTCAQVSNGPHFQCSSLSVEHRPDGVVSMQGSGPAYRARLKSHHPLSFRSPAQSVSQSIHSFIHSFEAVPKTQANALSYCGNDDTTAEL